MARKEDGIPRRCLAKDGRFSVELPVRPEHEVLTLTSKRRTITHHVYTAEDSGFIFTIDCADLSPQFVGQNVQDFLLEVQEELLKEAKATKTGQSVFQLHNYSGREVRFDLRGVPKPHPDTKDHSRNSAMPKDARLPTD